MMTGSVAGDCGPGFSRVSKLHSHSHMTCYSRALQVPSKTLSGCAIREQAAGRFRLHVPLTHGSDKKYDHQDSGLACKVASL